jgi:hypothetical protein
MRRQGKLDRDARDWSLELEGLGENRGGASLASMSANDDGKLQLTFAGIRDERRTPELVLKRRILTTCTDTHTVSYALCSRLRSSTLMPSASPLAGSSAAKERRKTVLGRLSSPLRRAMVTTRLSGTRNRAVI